jgi:hypothetical protein
MHLKLVTVTHESSSYQVFHSFYEEIRSEFLISAKAKNLFLSLTESIAQTLNATSCCVCGETNIGDHWPWEAKELDQQEPFNETFSKTQERHQAPKNFHHRKLLFLPHGRPILHPYRRLNLFRTEVLQ